MDKTFIAGVVFASSYALIIVLQQIFVRGLINPVHLNFFSYLIALLIFSGILAVTDRKTLIIRSKKGWILGIVAALSGSVLSDLFVLFGLQTSSSINWGLLSRLSLVVTFILSVIFLHERFVKRKTFSICFAFIGVILVVYKKGVGLQFNLGNIFFIVAVFGYSIQNVLTQQAMKYLSSKQMSFIRIITSAVILGLITFIVFPINKITIWGFIIINSFFIILGISMVNIVIKKKGAAFFTMIGTLVPVFTVIFSALILKIYPSIFQIIGGILIVGSIFIFEYRKNS